MSSTNPELAAALLAAAAALPSHFAGADDLTVEPLSAIQATTMSLPGGAIGVETKIKGSADLGRIVLVVTGLIDHKTGEVLNRDDARSFWTSALSDALGIFSGEVSGLKTGQLNMTDAFDALEAADESEVVGIFSGQTLAAMLLTFPSKATGKGAAASLAAAIAEAEAQDAAGLAPESDAAGDPEGSPSAEVSEASPAPESEAAAEASDETPTTAAGTPAGAVPMAAAGFGALYDPQAVAAAQAAQAAAHAAAQAAIGPAASISLPSLVPGLGAIVDPRRIDLLSDVVMEVSVELGRTRMTVHEILGLIPGSIVELDRAAGAPVDVLVNGKLIAHGEVVVVDEEFAVRISDIVNAEPARVIA